MLPLKFVYFYSQRLNPSELLRRRIQSAKYEPAIAMSIANIEFGSPDLVPRF